MPQFTYRIYDADPMFCDSACLIGLGTVTTNDVPNARSVLIGRMKDMATGLPSLVYKAGDLMYSRLYDEHQNIVASPIHRITEEDLY